MATSMWRDGSRGHHPYQTGGSACTHQGAINWLAGTMRNLSKCKVHSIGPAHLQELLAQTMTSAVPPLLRAGLMELEGCLTTTHHQLLAEVDSLKHRVAYLEENYKDRNSAEDPLKSLVTHPALQELLTTLIRDILAQMMKTAIPSALSAGLAGLKGLLDKDNDQRAVEANCLEQRVTYLEESFVDLTTAGDPLRMALSHPALQEPLANRIRDLAMPLIVANTDELRLDCDRLAQRIRSCEAQRTWSTRLNNLELRTEALEANLTRLANVTAEDDGETLKTFVAPADMWMASRGKTEFSNMPVDFAVNMPASHCTLNANAPAFHPRQEATGTAILRDRLQAVARGFENALVADPPPGMSEESVYGLLPSFRPLIASRGTWPGSVPVEALQIALATAAKKMLVELMRLPHDAASFAQAWQKTLDTVWSNVL